MGNKGSQLRRGEKRDHESDHGTTYTCVTTVFLDRPKADPPNGSATESVLNVGLDLAQAGP